MSTLIQHRLVNVVSPDPVAAGGLALNENFVMLADRFANIATTDPGPSQDESEGYTVGSRWFNTATNTEWVCVDGTEGSAIWRTPVADATTSAPGLMSAADKIKLEAITTQSATTDLRQVFINTGLLHSGGASPLDLNGGALTANSLHVSTGTTNTNALNFGSDTALYRSAPDTLRTDDAFVVAGSGISFVGAGSLNFDGGSINDANTITANTFVGALNGTASGNLKLPNVRRSSYAAPNSASSWGYVGDAITQSANNATAVGPTASAPFYLALNTNSTVGNVASASGNAIYRAGRNILFQAYAGSLTNANRRLWVGLTDQTAATMGASATPAGSFACFRYDTSAGDTTWRAITRDGTTANNQNTGVSFGNDERLKFEIACDDVNGQIFFYISGSLVATSTSNRPSGVNMRMMTSATTLTAANASIHVAWFYCESDL